MSDVSAVPLIVWCSDDQERPTKPNAEFKLYHPIETFDLESIAEKFAASRYYGADYPEEQEIHIVVEGKEYVFSVEAEQDVSFHAMAVREPTPDGNLAGRARPPRGEHGPRAPDRGARGDRDVGADRRAGDAVLTTSDDIICGSLILRTLADGEAVVDDGRPHLDQVLHAVADDVRWHLKLAEEAATSWAARAAGIRDWLTRYEAAHPAPARDPDEADDRDEVPAPTEPAPGGQLTLPMGPDRSR